MKKMKFDGYKCNVIIGQYLNGRPAIELIDAKNGEPVATPTINVPDIPLLKDEVIIKTYDYPAVLDALIKYKIILHPHREIQTGYVTCPVSFLVEGNNPSETMNK